MDVASCSKQMHPATFAQKLLKNTNSSVIRPARYQSTSLKVLSIRQWIRAVLVQQGELHNVRQVGLVTVDGCTEYTVYM